MMTAATANNHTDRFVATAVDRLVAQVRFNMTGLGMTEQDAIAAAKAGSIAGPAVWTLVERTLYAEREAATAQAELTNARARMAAAKTNKARRDAAEDVEFWGNKLAFLQHARIA